MAAAQGTPESEAGSFECFQNYTAPEVFVQGLAGMVDQQDVESMIRAQKQMLQRFEKTNEMLKNCSQLSANRLKTVGIEFKKLSTDLVEMKKDLDFVFKKIRIIKSKLSQQYPQAYNEAIRSSLAEEAIADEVDQGQQPLKPVVLQQPKDNKIEKDPDSDVPIEEFQFAKLHERPIQRKQSSSTDSDNEHKQDSSPCFSDTS